MATTDPPRPRTQRGHPAPQTAPAWLREAEARAAVGTEAELGRLIAEEIEVPLGPVAGKLAPLLEHQLRLRAREDVALRSPRALAADLQDWTEERLRALFAGMASGTARTLDAGVIEIERGHRERLEAALVGSGESTGALIAALHEVPLRRLADFEPASVGSPRRRVTLGAALPGPLGRRLVRAAAGRRLRATLSREAARVREELARLAREAVGGYLGELQAGLEGVAR